MNRILLSSCRRDRECVRQESHPQHLTISLSVLAGLTISYYFYKEAADDLRWEARAGTIPFDLQKVLVAMHEVGGELKPEQAIRMVGSGGHYVTDYASERILQELGKIGLVGLYIQNGQETEELDWANGAHNGLRMGGLAMLIALAVDPTWREEWLWSQDASLDDIAVRLTDEGKGVAQYLLKCERFPILSTEIWQTTGKSGAYMALTEKDFVKRVSPASDTPDTH